MFAFHEFLHQFCASHPDSLRGRARDPQAHALLIKLCPLQLRAEHNFWLSLRWVPTAGNGITDAITRPSREMVRLTAQAFQHLWYYFGEFSR